MRITIQDRLLAIYQAEKARLQTRNDEAYRKAVETKTFERIVAERVQRNIRLYLDKGTNIDIEV
jgi:hypothetical protein